MNELTPPVDDVPLAPNVERKAPWLVSYEDWNEQRGVEQRLVAQEIIQNIQVSVSIGLLAFALFIWKASYIATLSGWILAVVYVTFIGAFAYAIYLGKTTLQSQKWKSFAEQQDADWPKHSWNVDVKFIEGECVTGSDTGVIWLENSRLFFSGQRTSFALTRDDISDTNGFFENDRRLLIGKHKDCNLALKEPENVGDRTMNVRFGPGLPNYTETSLALLRTTLARFARSKPLGETGQLPPSIIGPGAMSRGQILLHGGVSSLVALRSTFLLCFLVQMVVPHRFSLRDTVILLLISYMCSTIVGGFGKCIRMYRSLLKHEKILASKQSW